MSPFESIFRKTLKDGFYEYCLKDKKIVPLPIGFMRGETFENTIVLVDECQNLTKREFHMLLSRIGKNCKVILSGDPRQVDIPDSGMEDAMERLRGVRGIDVVEFLEEDIVRSSMCKSIIKAYRD